MIKKQSKRSTSSNKNSILNFAAIFICVIFQSSFPCLGTCTLSTINQIINGNFSQPVTLQKSELFNSSILGWECSWICQLKNCIKGRQFWLERNKIDSDCIGQVIDLNSNYFNEKVHQKIDLKAGLYTLNFNYYFPIDNAKLKQLLVTFNNATIFRFKPQSSANFDIFRFSASVYAKDGNNVLQFANLGYAADGVGFKINNVSLFRQIDDFFEQSVSLFFEKCSYTNSAPGGRILFRSTLSFLLNFDRYELYMYHRRVYSYNEEQFILSVNEFLGTKSTLATSVLEEISNQKVQSLHYIAGSNKYKQKYIKYQSFNEEYHQVDYLKNLNQSFIIMFTFLIAFTLVLRVLFKVFFHKPISLLFAKFNFWPIILIMMFDGNIQMLTFCTFAEFKSFFSKCFQHKLLNIFILMFFFLMVFTAFALSFWIKFCYQKRAKYLLDEAKAKIEIVLGIAIDRGIICFLFGVVHQLLLEEPAIQLVLLGTIQILWIFKKIFYVCKKCYKEKVLAATSVMSGLMRVIFQVSIYIYEQKLENRDFINEKLHKFVIYGILMGASLQFMVGISYCFLNILKISKINSKSKVQNTNTDEVIKKANILSAPRLVNKCQVQKNNRINGRNNLYFFIKKNRPIKSTKQQIRTQKQKQKGKINS